MVEYRSWNEVPVGAYFFFQYMPGPSYIVFKKTSNLEGIEYLSMSNLVDATSTIYGDILVTRTHRIVGTNSLVHGDDPFRNYSYYLPFIGLNLIIIPECYAPK